MFERARDERSPGGFSLWPLEASTAAIIIKGVHERAVAKSAAGGSGSRGGETVGHAFIPPTICAQILQSLLANCLSSMWLQMSGAVA